jgi:ATPase subunit of ABC transporter with duplicated ATPase domains
MIFVEHDRTFCDNVATMAVQLEPNIGWQQIP